MVLYYSTHWTPIYLLGRDEIIAILTKGHGYGRVFLLFPITCLFSLQGAMVAGSGIGHHPLLLPGDRPGLVCNCLAKKIQGQRWWASSRPSFEEDCKFPFLPQELGAARKSSRLFCWRNTEAHERRSHLIRPAQLMPASSAIWLWLLERSQARIAQLSPVSPQN